MVVRRSYDLSATVVVGRSYAEALNTSHTSVTQFANSGKMKSSERDLQSLQIAHQKGSNGMHCTLKEM